MVSFWPWKGDDSSPASFEKTLANLSEKIQKSSIRLDSIKQQSRRLSVLWMLYAGFAYLLSSIILALVVGWRHWGPIEYSAVAGSPVLIYLVRLGVATFYDYRTSVVQAQVDDLQKQRDITIKKLKTATKYDSTQELLKKYGGTPTPKPKPAEGSDRKVPPTSGGHESRQGQGTAFVPPPTANIPGLQTPSFQHGSPQRPMPPQLQQQHSQLQQHFTPQVRSPTANFAPNAFPSTLQYAPANDDFHWYDRLMDVLLGEDETLPGKRLALICSDCRLVNGQAPPGVKNLKDVGQWRCGGCGKMNGEETDIGKIVDSIKNQDVADVMRKRSERVDVAKSSSSVDNRDEDSDITVHTEDEADETRTAEKTSKLLGEAETPMRRSTRPNKGKKDV